MERKLAFNKDRIRLPKISQKEPKCVKKPISRRANDSNQSRASPSKTASQTESAATETNSSITSPMISPRKYSSFELNDELENDDQLYESFMESIAEPEKPQTPLVDRIWSSNMINARRAGAQDNEASRKLRESLQLGSFLSDEAVDAMLKSYEDTIYDELRRFYPAEKLTRMSTQAYINLPKASSPSSSPFSPTSSTSSSTTRPLSRSTNNERHPNDLKKKYNVSRQLEQAMNIVDVIKKKKGEVTTGHNNYRTNDLVRDYEKWKNTCYSKIRI